MGNKLAKKTSAALPNVHLYFAQQAIKPIAYDTNKTPCNHPQYFTGSRIWAPYFNGIAIPKSNK